MVSANFVNFFFELFFQIRRLLKVNKITHLWMLFLSLFSTLVKCYPFIELPKIKIFVLKIVSCMLNILHMLIVSMLTRILFKLKDFFRLWNNFQRVPVRVTGKSDDSAGYLNLVGVMSFSPCLVKSVLLHWYLGTSEFVSLTFDNLLHQ